MKRALLLSAGFHLVMALFLLLPAWHLGRRVVVPSIHNVRLIELPRAPVAPPAQNLLPRPPVPKPPPKPVAKPPAPKPPAVKPPPPTALPSPTAPPAVETPPEPVPTPEAPPASTTPEHAPEVPVVSAPSVLPMIDAPEFDCSDYCRAFQRKVESQWAPPPLPDREAAQAIVVFTINRNGTVDGVSVEASSGNFYFDQAALRAILLAAPLPPLPRSFSNPTLRVHLAFTLQPVK